MLRPASPRLILHVVWIVLPLTVFSAVHDALDSASTPVAAVLAVLLWAGWGAGVVAVRVPRTVSLTALRVLAPASVVVAIWATVAGDVGGATVVALAWSGLTAGAVLLYPAVADLLVDGSSYGDERRFVLRTPPVLLLGPIEVIWAVAVAGVAAGPLLLAAGVWLAGGLALAAGLPAAMTSVRVLHRLSRRWLVFVPAGIVVHDPLVLAEPMLFPKRMIARFGPAPADATGHALDLTAGAPGLVLELRLVEPVAVVLTGRQPAEERTRTTDDLLVAAARPGAVGEEVQLRKLFRSG